MGGDQLFAHGLNLAVWLSLRVKVLVVIGRFRQSFIDRSSEPPVPMSFDGYDLAGLAQAALHEVGFDLHVVVGKAALDNPTHVIVVVFAHPIDVPSQYLGMVWALLQDILPMTWYIELRYVGMDARYDA